MTRGHKPGNGPKRNTSRRLRQLRTLGLLLAVGALAFFWQPLQQRLQGPAALRTVAAPEQALPLQALPADAAAVAVRKGLVYTLATDRLRAIRPDGSVQWEKTLPEPGVQLYPSFDGVLVRTGGGDLLRYNALGKATGRVAVPGEFSGVQESVSGLLFEDRQGGRYTWTDVSGKVLGTQEITGAHILKAVMDPNSGDTVIATLKSDGSVLESALHRFDAAGRITGARTFRDAVLLHMAFMDSRLTVVLDNRILSLDPQMRDYWLVRDPARYQGADFGPERFWVDRIQTGVQEAQALQCYDRDGQVVVSIPTVGDITLMEAGPRNLVAAVSGQRLQVFTDRGVLSGEIQLPKVPLGIHWLDEKHLLIRYGDGFSIEATEARKIL